MTDAQLDLLVGMAAIMLAQEAEPGRERDDAVSELLCDLIRRVTKERATPVDVKRHA